MMMKYIILCLLIPIFGVAYAQNPDINAITQALKKGDANTLVAYMDANISLDIKGKESRCSKQQAGSQITAFFAKLGIKDFKPLHSGASPGKDSKFVIGQLQSQSGASRVYIYMKKTQSGKFLISEIRFDD